MYLRVWLYLEKLKFDMGPFLVLIKIMRANKKCVICSTFLTLRRLGLKHLSQKGTFLSACNHPGIGIERSAMIR